MLYTTLLLAASALTVSAQIQINPGSVPADERASWCTAQRNTCPQICNGTGTTQNSCDSNTLQYSCVCSSGALPNISDYQQTLPFFVCQTSIAQCITANTDAAAQSRCRDVTCGSRNATAQSATTSSAAPSSTSASATSSGSSSASASGSATGSATPAASSGAAMALTVARDYGTPALLTGMLAIFGFAF
ncbi:hypothetical protein CAC42_3082 [Sphaceloma murrayae]|uniref:DUF7707 domain-containing protein n=1 Tax=Sphaceloma murrayae TaxID=2082308 RepID=A0A2K1QRH3_9PEZI|nr:hypothetical protein CAC42_3082 [Sphaceloma murrayae]